jgi:FkbM family methyltransferase
MRKILHILKQYSFVEIKQRLYSKLHLLLLRKMGFGQGTDPRMEHEIKAVEYVVSNSTDITLTVFDVGANAGQYLSILLPFIKKMDIYCFEPSITAFSKLKDTFGHSPVHLYNFGFSDTNRTAQLFTDYHGSGVASVHKRDFDAWNSMHSHKIIADKVEHVTLQTIDVFCREHEIDHIDFLKMDAEGHELSILKGAEQMLLAGKIRHIQFEFGECNIDSKTYFRDFWNLLSLRYDIYRMCQDGLIRMPEWSNASEIFTMMNYFAALKK